MEKRSPCLNCEKEKENRRLCYKTCKLLSDYRSFLDQSDDGITRGSTLSGGSGYKLILP